MESNSNGASLPIVRVGLLRVAFGASPEASPGASKVGGFGRGRLGRGVNEIAVAGWIVRAEGSTTLTVASAPEGLLFVAPRTEGNGMNLEAFATTGS